LFSREEGGREEEQRKNRGRTEKEQRKNRKRTNWELATKNVRSPRFTVRAMRGRTLFTTGQTTELDEGTF